MNRKWNKTLFEEKINFKKLPGNLKQKIKNLDIESSLEEYKEIFEELKVDFSDFEIELKKIKDKKEKREYLLSSLHNILPKTFLIDEVKVARAKYEILSNLMQVMNEKNYSYEKDKAKRLFDLEKEQIKKWEVEKQRRIYILKKSIREKELELEKKQKEEEKIDESTVEAEIKSNALNTIDDYFSNENTDMFLGDSNFDFQNSENGNDFNSMFNNEDFGNFSSGDDFTVEDSTNSFNLTQDNIEETQKWENEDSNHNEQVDSQINIINSTKKIPTSKQHKIKKTKVVEKKIYVKDKTEVQKLQNEIIKLKNLKQTNEKINGDNNLNKEINKKEQQKIYTIDELKQMKFIKLKEISKNLEVSNYEFLNKKDLMETILKTQERMIKIYSQNDVDEIVKEKIEEALNSEFIKEQQNNDIFGSLKLDDNNPFTNNEDPFGSLKLDDNNPFTNNEDPFGSLKLDDNNPFTNNEDPFGSLKLDDNNPFTNNEDPFGSLKLDDSNPFTNNGDPFKKLNFDNNDILSFEEENISGRKLQNEPDFVDNLKKGKLKKGKKNKQKEKNKNKTDW